MYEVFVLEEGYSRVSGPNMFSNCTCTLIKGPLKVIVDTMTAWDSLKIIAGLARHKLTCNDIDYVICTHGHSDHIGNNNLFLKARHIVGFDLSFQDKYTPHPFDKGESLELDKYITVVPTIGHTLNDVSVIVKTIKQGAVVIAGDLFEREQDISDPSIWKSAGSLNPEEQLKNRNLMLMLADWIVPGHGPMFEVTNVMKSTIPPVH